MKPPSYYLSVLLLLAGCGGWGGYVHDSERFKFKLTFPDGWEVWDKSDDTVDFLQATYREKPETKIEVLAVRTAPDLEPNEIFPFFLGGSGDAVNLQDFAIEEKGTVSAQNGDGRFIKVRWTGEKLSMRGIRALFIGNRYRLSIVAEMSADDFPLQEAELMKMLRMLQL